MTDSDRRAYRTISKRLVRVEERGVLLRNLLARGIGLKDEEDFISRVGKKFKSGRKFGKKKEIGKTIFIAKKVFSYLLLCDVRSHISVQNTVSTSNMDTNPH